ncbi:hypothetical protein H5410_016227 [Solanum commersonii]|uniref:SET domain-containing protein n=1 Tax=Solanum commersonii TaxID=4109 RepID=A0A9J5ZWE8_SOLCO|nr:hypothetical protein H5410_016227 [Solanum commersonii]
MVLPKQLEGLGIKDLALHNKCLLMKWLWRYTQVDQTLWKEVIKAKHGVQNHWCSKLSRSSHGVGLWKSICKLKAEFFQNTKLAAGNGIQIRFWKDRWLDNIILREEFPRLFQIAHEPNLLEGQVINVQESDKLRWGSDKDGKHSVKAGYANSYAPNEVLDNWPWNFPIDVTCANRTLSPTTIFLHCTIDANLWSMFLSIFGINWVMRHSTQEVFECWYNWRVGKAIKPIWKMIPASIFCVYGQKETTDVLSYVTDEPDQVKLQCLLTTTKGRGMFCVDDVSEASLVHKEDPYAAVILKKCRETHCHFCFNELPADAISCASCSIPLYCSDWCQIQAGAPKFDKSSNSFSGLEGLADDLKNYMSDVVLAGASTLDTGHIAEHRHECHGFHWPLILPSEVVLAGRILVKVIEQNRRASADSNLVGFLDLSHNYLQLPPESKLEMHIYSIILLHCLQHFYRTELPISGIMPVILLSQIQVNSMAVVRMQALEVKGPIYEPGNALTSNLEQVKVGQAVYVAGSFFNHSCQPNIHTYFLSRTLHVHATEYILAGSELELSYGPQVGQWDCKDRQRLLEDRYSFTCQCTGCSELNVSDLVINAYRCTKLNCLGVILDHTVTTCEKQKLKLLIDSPTVYKVQRDTIPPPPSNVDCILEVGSLKRDPKERKPIFGYDTNIRDVVRRHYILIGPYQPKLCVYPKTMFRTKDHQFNPPWFKPPHSAWFEYNIKDDVVFCLCCLLFKNEFESRDNAGKSFIQDGLE